MNIDFIITAESYYKAKMDEAALTMRLYTGAAVGIGEHPQVFQEFISALENFKEARESYQLVQELKADLVKQNEKESEDES
tara:strand:+ start:10259 stop:10501 length:243 start_codon:yes stop_codon:yes gene_type:complete